MMKSLLLVVFYIVIYSSCTHKEPSINIDIDIDIVDKNLSKAIAEFQDKYVPNKNKIILLEFFYIRPFGRRAYSICKVETPHLFSDNRQYFIAMVNETMVFLQPPGFVDIAFPIDSNKVNQIINEKYYEYLIQEEYEINLSTIHDCWYVFGENNSKVFNMIDSISVYGTIEGQYKKLTTQIEKY